MEQQILTKNETIRKIRSGSGIIAAVCIVSALFYIIAMFSIYKSMSGSHSSIETKQILIRNIISYGIDTFVMFLASTVFCRIAKDGCPFTSFNIMTVRAMGALLILNGVLGGVIPAVMSGSLKFLLSMINPSGIASGMLVLFISFIMHYAVLLQIESDETL